MNLIQRFLTLALNERQLFFTAIFALFLGLICLGSGIFKGFAIFPYGDLGKAASFNLAISVFILTTALILPFSNFSPASLALFRWSIIVSSLFSLGIETIQHFRGVDPRFPDTDNPMDETLGIAFGAVAITMIIFYTILTFQFFKSKVIEKNPFIVLGIRYGLISTMVAFLAGIWIIVEEGRFTGENGNIIWLHGLGFHGLQTVPFLAWLIEKQSLNKKILHLCGISWISFILLIGLQTYLGYSIFRMNVISVFSSIFFLIWVGTWIIGMISLRQHLNRSSSRHL
jgi:hypothetical protein